MKNLKLKDFFYGLILGSGLLAPGLSIATLALILGIYETLIDAVNDFFSRRMKSALPFLIPFGIGAVIAVGISSRAISLAYDYFPTQTYAFFLGLIVASVPLIWKSSGAKSKFKKNHYLLLAVVAVLVGALRLVDPVEGDYMAAALSMGDAIQLFFSGAIAVAAMFLPGLSGALMLMLLGTHSMLTHAVSTLNLPLLGVTVLGAVVGLVVLGKLLKYLLNNYLDMVYAASIGMIIGSIFIVFPDLTFQLGELVTSAAVFAVGYLLIFLLERKK